MTDQYNKNHPHWARSIGDIVRIRYKLSQGTVAMRPLLVDDDSDYDAVIVRHPDRSPAIVVGVHPKDSLKRPGSNRDMLVMCEGRLGYVWEDWMEEL